MNTLLRTFFLALILALSSATIASAQSVVYQGQTLTENILCGIPTNFTTTPIANGAIRFSWTNNASVNPSLGVFLFIGPTLIYPLAAANFPTSYDVNLGALPAGNSTAYVRNICSATGGGQTIYVVSLRSNTGTVVGMSSTPLAPARPAPAPSPPSTPPSPALVSISSQLIVGATVRPNVSSLRVRQTPSLNGFILGFVNMSAQGRILGGPIFASGYAFYQVVWTLFNGTTLTGWSALYGASGPLVIVTSTPNPPTPPAPTPAPQPTPTTSPAPIQLPTPAPTPTTASPFTLIAPVITVIRAQNGAVTFAWTNPNGSNNSGGYTLQWRNTNFSLYTQSANRLQFNASVQSYTINSISSLMGFQQQLYFSVIANGLAGMSYDSIRSDEVFVDVLAPISPSPAPAPPSLSPLPTPSPMPSTTPTTTTAVGPTVLSPGTPIPPPPPVQNLIPSVTVTAVPAQPTTFNVSWLPVTDSIGSRLTRSFNSNFFPASIIGTIYDSNITQYIDVFPLGANGSSNIVYYKVQIIGANPYQTYPSSIGFSPILQTSSSAPVAPLTPINVTVLSPNPYINTNNTTATQRSSRVRWQIPSGSPAVVLYRIERSFNASFTNSTILTTTASGGLFYDDIFSAAQGSGFPTNNQALIYYRVSASNSAGEWSAPSAPASVLANP